MALGFHTRRSCLHHRNSNSDSTAPGSAGERDAGGLSSFVASATGTGEASSCHDIAADEAENSWNRALNGFTPGPT